MQYFVSVLLFLVAWKLASMAETRDSYWLLPTAIMATGGLLLGQDAVVSAVSQASPFHSRVGRLLWAVRPRGWMVAWAMIFLVNTIWGTPHIIFQYGPANRCVYVGWQGAVRLPADGDGVFAGCRLFRGVKAGLS